MSEPLPTIPSTSFAITTTYNTLNQLFLPPNFAYPLVESFAAAHDPLLVEHAEKVLTAGISLREAGVQLDAITRNMARTDPSAIAKEAESNETITISLSEVKKARLRARLQSQSQQVTTKQSILREYQQRKAEFDVQMGREEEGALQAFKKGLRDTVLATSGRV